MNLPDPPTPPDPHGNPRPEVKIAVSYAVLACLWIIGSDIAVQRLWTSNMLTIQTVKGLNFVATTALLLYFVLRKAYHGWRQAERERWSLLSGMSERFRALSARAENLREADRTRISRELHDQLGQALTGLKMDLRWLEGQLERFDNRALNPLTDRLVETEEQVDDMIATVQAITSDLRPDALDHLGLPSALVQEADRFTVRTGVPCDVIAGDLPKALPPEVATAAFRIIQEALTNVARHAGANRARLVCVTEASFLRVNIFDDGRGIPPGAEEDDGALGLLGMRERAELLGGQFAISAQETGGTRVEAVLPWRRR